MFTHKLNRDLKMAERTNGNRKGKQPNISMVLIPRSKQTKKNFFFLYFRFSFFVIKKNFQKRFLAVIPPLK